MKNSRTKNSFINVSIATISKILHLILSFVCRTYFIKILGSEYLGINGLFTNILTILSFAELGIGNAIIFKLYKPIAEENKERIKTLIHFYKKVYCVIGSFILIVGLMIIPFLNKIIYGTPDINEDIRIIYVLFLFNTTISYFFTYKKSIITGYQKEYVINLIDLTIAIIQNIVQIIFLIITHNFIIYLIIQIIGTIFDNVISAILANKMFPYIKDKNYTKLDIKERKNIYEDVKSIVLYKLFNTVSAGTDNIIISKFLGVSAVGLLSNYTLITQSIIGLLKTAFNGLKASIGNLNTIKEAEKKEAVFYQTLLLSFLVYGYVAIATTILINKFIIIWIGEKYVLGIGVCIALGLDFYIDGIRFVNYTYRDTLGLFKKGRLMPLFSAICNILLSIILVKYIGIFGVLIATVISKLCVLNWYDPYLIHKTTFKTSAIRYVKTFFYYFIITILTFIISLSLVNKINIYGILGFVIDGIVITCIVFIIFLLSTCKLEEFKELKKRVLLLIKKEENNNE